MKILLLGFSKIKFMPYANFYLSCIDKEKNDVHLLYWNRDTKKENISDYPSITLHEFKRYQEDNVPYYAKIKSFLKYRKFAKKILKENGFDFIIVLHTMPGVLLFPQLVKKYKNRFIFDYRDSTFEYKPWFKKITGRLITASKYTFTSSNGFRIYFPESEKNKTYTSHNISKDSLSHRNYEKIKHDKVRIAFWGLMRDEVINRKLIERIADDKRFELHYYGREQQVALNLKKHAKNLSADNVFFHGEYVPAERYEFVRSTDIIHNIFNSRNMMLAMGNKYYDGAIFYIPQLCMNNSFMGKTATNAKIGFECDPNDEDFTQKVFDYFTQIDKAEFVFNCDKELGRVENEYLNGENILKHLFS